MILVTGGTGFIGRVLIEHLVSLGKPVRTLLRPSQVSPNLPRGMPVEVAVCSLKDERGLRAALKGVDVIFHLAGTERLGTRADLAGVDIEGTQALIQVAAQAGVQRFFFLSHLGADRLSAYPVLKAKAIAEAQIIRSGIGYTIFRSAVVYGPNDQFTTSIAQILKLSPGFFLMPGNGTVLIQPLWVEDLVACLVYSLQDPKMTNQIYSVGGCECLEFQHVIRSVEKAVGIRRLLIPLPPSYLRGVALMLEQSFPQFPISIFWVDYLATDRTCPLDTLPRVFGLMPARFNQQLGYLRSPARSAS
jgi:NADH dehydrogenase